MKRFWDKVPVRAQHECWEWQGYRTPKGYGSLLYLKKMQRAHRVAWQLANGPIPEGMVIMHTCDNRACVNVAHLRLGTQLENIADRDNKGRGKPRPGVLHHKARLTEAQVREIFLAPMSYGGAIKLAEAYGVSVAAIHDIRGRRAWLHITQGLSRDSAWRALAPLEPYA